MVAGSGPAASEPVFVLLEGPAYVANWTGSIASEVRVVAVFRTRADADAYMEGGHKGFARARAMGGPSVPPHRWVVEARLRPPGTAAEGERTSPDASGRGDRA